MRYPGPTKNAPGSEESKIWRRQVGRVRVHYRAPYWIYDSETKKNIYIQGFFFSWIDYGQRAFINPYESSPLGFNRK